jgi:murein L,D-transpeptidase YafK
MAYMLMVLCLQPIQVAAQSLSSDAELKFIDAIDDINNNRIDQAIEQFSQLTKQAPKFTLAKLIYADLLSSRVGLVTTMGDTTLLDPVRLKAFKDEARIRVLYHQRKSLKNQIPKDLVQMTDEQPYAIMVDISLSRLYLFANDNGVPKLIKDFYASSGKAGSDKQKKGDNKTPVGVYFVTGRIPDKELPSKYGAGALPLNYPNSWDNQLRRTGHGIWLHGSPIETYSRQPQASEGCISLTNLDFAALDKMVDIKSTPVVIGRNIEWISKTQWQTQQVTFNRIITDWITDWESLDASQYSGNYSSKFKTHRDNYKSWTSRRTWANSRKEYITIDIKNLSLFTYPDNKGLLVASFSQTYQSNNYTGEDVKRQFWRKEADGWKVVYEGEPSKGRR